MGDIRDPATDQQLPVPNNQPAIQDLVIADIAERKALGIRKYGTVLQAFNGRSALQDAYGEVLDLAMYLRQAIEEEKHGHDIPDPFPEIGRSIPPTGGVPPRGWP